MCLAVYVGSQIALPVRPWAAHLGQFHVEVLADGPGPDEIRRQLQRPYLYVVGAYEGCACGFKRPYDDEELPKWVAALAELTAWLRAAVEAGPIEVVICWLGDENKKARRRRIQADAIADVDFGAAGREPLRLTVHR